MTAELNLISNVSSFSLIGTREKMVHNYHFGRDFIQDGALTLDIWMFSPPTGGV